MNGAMDLFGLNGKSALIAGGGQGMGRASALTLSRFGARIVVLDIVPERAEAVVKQIRDEGVEAASVVGDILNGEALQATYDACEAAFEGLNILVTIPGSSYLDYVINTDDSMWDVMVDKNARYVFRMAQMFARARVKDGKPGSCVFITSTAGLRAAPGYALYGVVKAGMVSYVKTMAVEFAQLGIRVNAIAPAVIETDTLVQTPEWTDLVQNGGGVPMRRMGSTQEIANAVLFLASDQGSWVTGHTLPVDGGSMSAVYRYVTDIPEFPRGRPRA
jgi:NAD(P)-dependent dehydrogenase (short-subunit alcohol dehydrogenase family)